MHTDYEHLIAKLDAFIRKYYKDRLIRGVLYSVALLVLFFLAAALLEHVGHFGTTARTVLFWGLIRPDRLLSPPGVTRATLERTLRYIERSSARLADARPGVDGAGEAITPEAARAEGARVVAEFGWVRDMLQFSCRRGIAPPPA